MREPEIKMVAILCGTLVFIFVLGICGEYFSNKETVMSDDFIHPETTETTKWQKMSPTTRDALLGIYFENMEECSRYISEENGVTVGESAILFLMECYDKSQREPIERANKKAREILGIDDEPKAWTTGKWMELMMDSGKVDANEEVVAGRFKTTEEPLGEIDKNKEDKEE